MKGTKRLIMETARVALGHSGDPDLLDAYLESCVEQDEPIVPSPEVAAALQHEPKVVIEYDDDDKDPDAGVITVAEHTIDPEATKLLPRMLAKKYGVIAVKAEGRKLFVATTDPSNVFAQDDIIFLTGMEVAWLKAKAEDIAAAINRWYNKER